MTTRHSSLGSHLVLSLVAASTTWVAMLSWRHFTVDDAGFLRPLLALAVTVGLLGALGRWRRVPTVLVLGGQLVIGGALASYLIAGTPVPGAELRLRIDSALDAANTYASPVPDDGLVSVLPLLVVGGLAAMLLVDLLAGGLRRASLAGLPLLTVYSVPVGMLGDDLEWWIFALSALGFAALLFLQEQSRLGRWGRSLGSSAPAAAADPVPRRRSAAVRTSAGGIAVAAVAAALVVPLAIPTLQLQVFDLGSGSGGDGEIDIVNPIVDLRRDLKRGADLPLVRFRTDDPSPEYLRISVLNRFTDNEWSSGDRDVPSDQVADGTPLPIDGVSAAVPRTEHTYDVSVEQNFESTWLPTQAPISSVTAEGDWRYDTATMDFIASDDGLDTSGLDYTMTSVDLDLSAQRLANSASTTSAVSEEVREVPDDLPDLVRQLAQDVTANAATSYEKAVALQQWFRSDGGFTYDLENSPSGNGVDDLVAFLREDGRVGYCEQFAASMAVMARVIGIPSRVAIGFLQPREIGSDTWEYSAGDLHAWPELYFSGSGWVRFEPTPPDRAAQVPSYTRQDVPVDNPSETPSASASPEPRPGQSNDAQAAPTEPVDEQDTAATSGDDEGAIGWGRVLGVLALVVLLVLLALAPGVLRRRRRARRLRGGIEDAWAELRDTCVDLGVPWPDERSPRETQQALAASFADPDHAGSVQRPARGASQAPAASSALARLTAEVERRRYAGSATPSADAGWADDVEACIEALAAGVGARSRRRSRWLPRSLWRTAPGATASSSEAEQLGRVVEHI